TNLIAEVAIAFFSRLEAHHLGQQSRRWQVFGQREGHTGKTANGMRCWNRPIRPAAAPSRATVRHQFKRHAVRVSECKYLLIEARGWSFNAEATRRQALAPVAQRSFGHKKGNCADLASALEASGRARPGKKGQN